MTSNIVAPDIVSPDIVAPDIVSPDIVSPDIVALIKIYCPQKRAISYGIFETRFWEPIETINIKRIKWTLGHI